MAQNGQRRPSKVLEKYKSITKMIKLVQNLSNETAEKWLKMIGIDAKGPTVHFANFQSHLTRNKKSHKLQITKTNHKMSPKGHQTIKNVYFFLVVMANLELKNEPFSFNISLARHIYDLLNGSGSFC